MAITQEMLASTPDFQEARDRTLYWTLSFYIPAHQLGERQKVPPIDAHTLRLRDAIEPMFNDIADRSRQGEIPDRLFAAAHPEEVWFQMPPQIRWTTEGCTFTVGIPDEEWRQRQREVKIRRFWYQYANGALSWNLSFDYFYGDDLAAERPGTAPLTYYFMSLLQKLAWPKEFRCTEGAGTLDDIVGIEIFQRQEASRNTAEAGEWRRSWFTDFVQSCFTQDAVQLSRLYTGKVVQSLSDVLEQTPSIEVPGLLCHDARSLFFIQDRKFFQRIQPEEGGELVSRRKFVLEKAFDLYPKAIKEVKRRDGRDAVMLDDTYWKELRPAGDAAAAQRLDYLFLAGFNQNIIDFTNQEASEVLDSLEPIYPDNDGEESSYIRYANPRAVITYARRSRSLEIGNDYIGMCPYSFLVHTLSIHNEALARQQERSTFEKLEQVKRLMNEEEYDDAELLINKVRLDAFDQYDQHRYINPFRYETERDTFAEIEKLRGTSRLQIIYKEALTSLEDNIRDLSRLREKKLAELRHAEADEQARRDRRFNFLLAAVGLVGVIQADLAIDEFIRGGSRKFDWLLLLIHVFFVPTVLLLIGLMLLNLPKVALPGRKAAIPDHSAPKRWWSRGESNP